MTFHAIAQLVKDSSKLVFLLAALSFASVLQAQNFTDGFPFLMPPNDSTTQSFLPVFERKPITDFVTISPQGRFQVNNQPTRFWGVNLTENANFPDQGDADILVGRMRKMGINLVRFHHMDNPWTSNEGNIFNDGNTLYLNPFVLQKFHYLLSKMKEEGIYANLNLLVTRQFSEADGVPGIDSVSSPEKVVSMFDAQLIQLQKSYASQILTSYNIFTGLPLYQDPVLAMVEINNENSIYGFWKQDYLHPITNGGGILSRHADTLDLKWNLFLKEKYTTHAALASAWSANGNAGPELIMDGGFEAADIHQSWIIELNDGAEATLSQSDVDPFSGNYSAQVNIPQAVSTDWHVQFKQINFPIQKDTTYIVKYAIKSSSPFSIWTGLMNDGPPYNGYGGDWVDSNTEWQEHQFFFKPDEDNLTQSRLSFSLGAFEGDVFIDQVSIQKHKKQGLSDGENLDVNNIQRFRYSDRNSFVDQRVADLAAFYIKLQADYYNEMYDFLRNTVGVQAPITGSNALGGLYETMSADGLDYMDDHAYWDHVNFPNGWSSTDWDIENLPIVSDPYLSVISGLFGGLAKANTPYTVSEYNHPTPNIYQAEMVPILASYASFHGTDGVMFFEYNGGNPANWWSNQVDGFFGLRANPAVMSLFPVFAKAYRDFMIQEDPAPLTGKYTESYVYNMPQDDNHGRWWKYFPYDQDLALTHSIRTDGFDHANVELPTADIGTSPYQTTTNEITFDADLQLIHTQAAKIESLTGKLDNASQMTTGKMQVSSQEHGVVSWISLTENDLANSQKSLLAISSRFQNTGMVWDGTNTIHDNWGEAPTEMKPLVLDFQLDIEADSIHLYPLDGTGAIMESITYLPQGGKFQLTIDQNQLQSLWFGIEAFHHAVATTNLNKKEVNVFPNPVKQGQYLQINGLDSPTHFKLISSIGQIVLQGVTEKGFFINDLPTGIYRILLTDNTNKSIIKSLEIH